MRRTQRNLTIIVLTIALTYLVLIRLPWAYGLAAMTMLILAAVALAILGRDFLIGRYCMRRRQWQKALTRLQGFEKLLLRHPWSRFLTPLYASMYSFDGVAVARNNIAVAHMNLGELDEAERILRLALQRDPLYALPYLNLGMIAAMRKQEDVAEGEIRKAVRLGYSPSGAQQILRRALAAANAGAGRILK
jgi:tetratricopeptide (TPR) repeat protein